VRLRPLLRLLRLLRLCLLTLPLVLVLPLRKASLQRCPLEDFPVMRAWRCVLAVL
jgi:hypothetical protein